MSYDFEKWVDEDIAAGRHRWVRWTCLIAFVALPASFAMENGGLTVSAAGGLVSALLVLVGMIAGLTAFFSPYARTVWRPPWKAPAPALDERERDVIARAHAKAYGLVTAAILIALLYAWLAVRAGWWLPRDRDGVNGLLRTILIPLAILPVALAEWSVAPPPDDGEE